jgi:hypothetical protein
MSFLLMSKFHRHLNEARKDVDAAIEVWKSLINNRLSDTIAYSYVKGSAIKKWDSDIDYVPIISDIDIHIGTIENKPLIPKHREGFRYSLKTTELYEKYFRELRPDYFHIPRLQIVLVNEQQRFMLPEKTDHIKLLSGEIMFREEESVIECRKRDLELLEEIGVLLDRLPVRVIDRIGLEYYRVLRELCWVVSPTPVRVLSQFSDSKLVWRLNRTNVVNGLQDLGLEDLAMVYRSYYLKGWEAFKTSFRDNKVMRELLLLAYDVLTLSYQTIKNIKSA